MTYYGEDESATKGGYNLRNTDGTVKQTQIGTHVTITLQGIGDKGERHGEHGSPGASDEQEGDELHLLVVEEGHHGKAYGT